MGRKGVSKRKTSQTKNKPLSKGTVNGSISSMIKAGERQPARVSDVDKTIPSPKSTAKPSSDRTKKAGKG
jgi:hypothetical protein